MGLARKEGEAEGDGEGEGTAVDAAEEEEEEEGVFVSPADAAAGYAQSETNRSLLFSRLLPVRLRIGAGLPIQHNTTTHTLSQSASHSMSNQKGKTVREKTPTRGPIKLNWCR